MSNDDLRGVPIHTIEIHQLLDSETGDIVDWCKAETTDGEPIPLGTALGMLRLAEDTLIRTAMGEPE